MAVSWPYVCQQSSWPGIFQSGVLCEARGRPAGRPYISEIQHYLLLWFPSNINVCSFLNDGSPLKQRLRLRRLDGGDDMGLADLRELENLQEELFAALHAIGAARQALAIFAEHG